MTILTGVAASIAAIVVALAWAERSAHARFAADAARVRTAAGVHDGAVVTEQDLRDLPEPMARYLRFSGSLGRKRISDLHCRHSGRFRPGTAMPWLPIRGEYFMTTKRPSFMWYGRIGVGPGISITAFDSYASEHARMLVRALSLFTIVDDRSRNVVQSAFGRCVAELTMAPTFFLDRSRVRCVQTGPNQARCTVTDGTNSADAEFFINPDGSLDRVVVMRCFDRGGGRTTLERFTARCSEQKDFGGRRLASKVDGVWNLPEGDFHYVSFDFETAEFE